MNSALKALYELATDRPLSTVELLSSSDYYGHATVLKRYAMFPKIYQIKAVVEHGVFVEQRVYEAEINAALPAYFTFSPVRHKVLRKHTDKAMFSIGPLLHYAPHFLSSTDLEAEKKRLGKNLLVFPAHSTHWIDCNYDVSEFCRSLEEAGKEFDNVRVCLYWKDILRGLAQEYMSHGFECVTAGHMFDPQFISRLKSLIETATITASNNIGTSLGYCIYMAKPHWFLFTQMSLAAEDISIFKRDVDLSKYEKPHIHELMKLFSERRGDISDKQKDIIDLYWGLSETKPPEQMQHIIGIAEELYQKNANSRRVPNRFLIRPRDDYRNLKTIHHKTGALSKQTAKSSPDRSEPTRFEQWEDPHSSTRKPGHPLMNAANADEKTKGSLTCTYLSHPQHPQNHKSTPAFTGAPPIFIDIPKAGGDALRRLFQNEFGASSLFWIEVNQHQSYAHHFKNLPDDIRSRIRLIDGHLWFGIHELLGVAPRYVTILRNPIDRIILHYYHVLQQPDHYLHQEVISKRMTLLDYATSGVAAELENDQTRRLCGFMSAIPRDDSPNGRKSLEIAKKNLREHFLTFGLAERYEETLKLFANRLGWVFPKQQQSKNSTDIRFLRSRVPDRTIEAIAEHNSLDIKLYGVAKNIFEKQIFSLESTQSKFAGIS